MNASKLGLVGTSNYGFLTNGNRIYLSDNYLVISQDGTKKRLPEISKWKLRRL